jgi:hypothetical protein
VPTPSATDAALAARCHAADVLDAWDTAVASWRACWAASRAYAPRAVLLPLTYDMDDTALAASRVSGWKLESPAAVANGH